MARPVRAAFISDVHSNLEALLAVLGEIGEVETYCMGDVVGYGASPNEVIAALKEKGVRCIVGNHDYAVLSGRLGDFNARAAMALVWTSKHISDSSRSFLASLPQERRARLGGEVVYMTHGSPDDRLWEYVHPATHAYLFGHYLAKLAVGAVALGHTHVPFSWNGEGGVVFNPGSVGQPRNGDSRASYALLSLSEGGFSVEHRVVAYDTELAARKIADAGLPESFGRRLFVGR